MEKHAKKALIAISDSSPQRIMVRNDINAWNETHDRKKNYNSTPIKLTPLSKRHHLEQPRQIVNNPIGKLKSIKRRLMSSPSPLKTESSNQIVQTQNTCGLGSTQQIKLPELKSFRQLSIENKQNLPVGSSNLQYRSKSMKIRKKQLCMINLLPCKFSNSSAVIEKNIRKQLAAMERKRTNPLKLIDNIVPNCSFFSKESGLLQKPSKML